MAFKTFAAAAALAASAMATVPSLSVPACPETACVEYSKSVPDLTAFPRTRVDACYTDTSIALTFTAFEETSFYTNSSLETNGDIWMYNVMEAFIYKGTDDPQTYFEYEVSPGNVTYQAVIFNPTEDRSGAFDHFFVSDPLADGFSASTTLDREAHTWVSESKIPLALFNVKDGQAKGTEWRMNFFRTITSEETFPDQQLGAWSPPDEASFHITKFLGHVEFV